MFFVNLLYYIVHVKIVSGIGASSNKLYFKQLSLDKYDSVNIYE